LASVTVTLYVPAVNDDRSSVIAPFDQLYEYGAVPPDTVKLAAPVEFPKHNTFVPVMLAVSAEAGCVIVTLAVVVHPLASVTVTEYVPAVNDDRSSVITPFDQL
jgi:hypothetical protein